MEEKTTDALEVAEEAHEEKEATAKGTSLMIFLNRGIRRWTRLARKSWKNISKSPEKL